MNNINLNKVQSRDLVQVHTVPVTKMEVAESDAAPNKTTKNMSIVPNDRDIPIFLEDHDDEQYSLSHKTSRNLKSK